MKADKGKHWAEVNPKLDLLLKNVGGRTEGKNQTAVRVTPYCGEYPGPRFEDKFRSANQMDGISKADEIKWLPVNL